MLNPNNDRLDYGQMLAPPADYELDFAVGTTYSLDLDALVGASLALGLAEETDSALKGNPICLLEALRSTGDKVAMFCESGQIHIPNHPTALYILLEKMVFSVKTRKEKRIAAFPSFHPKFWLIRYINKSGQKKYRVIVLSRNLTFDRSWDVSCYLDGAPGDAVTEKNEPVCDFLRFLQAQLPNDENGKAKSKGIREFIRELPSVIFELDGKTFYDYEFIPNGIRKAGGDYYRFEETPLFRNTFHDILIMSPFVSNDIIRSFNLRNQNSLIENTRYMLITRQMSLSRLKPEDVNHFEIYTMRDQVIDGESAISDDTESIQQQDIHAKLYMIRKNSNTDLYLGSLNASHNAVYGNVEFMICLKAYRRYLNMSILRESLFGKNPDNPDNPFQQVELRDAVPEEDAEKNHDLEAVIKEICRGYLHASVLPDGDEHYALRVSLGEIDAKGYQITIRPLLSKKTEAYACEVVFSALTLLQLSEFYILSVSDGERTVERVIMIPTDGMPEDREHSVVTSVVSDKQCFYRYIAFLLGDDMMLSALETEGEQEMIGEGRNARRQADMPALYEKMLQTAATRPEKFRGIEYLMKTISEDGVIPDEFKTLYETFRKVVNLDG